MNSIKVQSIQPYPALLLTAVKLLIWGFLLKAAIKFSGIPQSPIFKFFQKKRRYNPEEENKNWKLQTNEISIEMKDKRRRF